jgi:GNAT superfamily N-acetyltransferase
MITYSQKSAAELTDTEVEEAAMLCSAADTDPRAHDYGRSFRVYRDRPNTTIFLARDGATGALAGVVFLLDLTYSNAMKNSVELQAYMLQQGIQQSKCAVPAELWLDANYAGQGITSTLLRLAEEDAKAKGFMYLVSFVCLRTQAYETLKRVYGARWVETGIPEPLRQPPYLQQTANDFVHFIPI